MKLSSTLFASALLALSVGVAAADPVSIGSYATTSSNPGYSNSATMYVSGSGMGAGTVNGGTTYYLPTEGIWANPVGSSTWVGINPNDHPLGTSHEPNGTYYYNTTFVLGSNVADMFGSLTVMADDTTSVFLNGKEILDPAAAVASVHCTVGQPNCTSMYTFDFSGLQSGTNTLSFGVEQLFDHATGLDYAGTVGVTPEPNSLLLLGSGLTTMAGFVLRRRKVQA